jgi:enolase
MDPAASEFLQAGSYALEREQRVLGSSEMVGLYSELAERHPALMSLEDGLAEDDWDGWVELQNRVGSDRLIVGDDLTVTNAERVRRAIDLGAINALLVKPNQAGTLTSTIKAIQAARSGGCEIVVSHRGGGETNDTFIVDLAIASGAAYLKCGITRGERVEKYNYLMEIESTLRAGNRP